MNYPFVNLVGIIVTALALLVAPAVAADDLEALEFFEREVRPILVDKCSGCHGDSEQAGGLRVDRLQSLLDGGETAAAVVPSDPSKSLIMRAVRRTGELAMPPDEELSRAAIHSLEQWIEMGAAWPEAQTINHSPSEAARNHWAFQPVHMPQLPATARHGWARTPVDHFVLNALEKEGLSPSPPADRRTLIRRVAYALTGLPPTYEQVQQFVDDPDEKAYEKLVERLLASPEYGQHWARHWLDVARYSDTKGYVYAREERFWVHAWVYRDWVVQSLNQDMPYDRFLLLQLAADQVDDRQQRDLAAMGFLTLGRRFLGVRRDIIDDRIDVVTRGTMGLTVSCARCHDHKYDPIPTADYYSLYGVFDSCVERYAFLRDSLDDDAFETELHKRQTELTTKMQHRRDESAARVRSRVADYLFAQSELHKFPADGFDQIFEKDDLLPAFVRRWEHALREAEESRDPIFLPWHAYRVIPSAEFPERAVDVTKNLPSLGESHPLVAKIFEVPPATFRDVCERYAQIFATVTEDWENALAQANEHGEPLPLGLDAPHAEALRRWLYGSESPCEVPAGPIVQTETYFDSGACTELWKLQGEVDRWLINGQVEAPVAVTLVDLPVPAEPRVFLRGNQLTPGAEVPRQFLSALSPAKPAPFQDGSGRLELARAIIDPHNPLTARVIINRIWTQHFGHGLVSTPSDFGTRAAPPSHPALLDWLAGQFMASGWSLKQLHRWMLLSATFQQSSTLPEDSSLLDFATTIDANNRLLWRMNPRRLSFEEFRDSLIHAGSQLNRIAGGKPVDLLKAPFPHRRTIYGLVDRQYFPAALRVFDFANPDLHTPIRNETTVPQQALFFLNHPLVLAQAQALAEKVDMLVRDDLDASEGELPVVMRAKAAAIFQQVLQRSPSDREMLDAISLLDEVGEIATSQRQPDAVADWQYGYGALDSDGDRVLGFAPLPHFTGTAWQGGPAWPDASLGWVQLTAGGGHPGNDRQHAAVRRWTAPDKLSLKIKTEFVHEPVKGDGVRAFIVSSRSGTLLSRSIHHAKAELDVEALEVEAGETLDFLVDIGNVLNSDQYEWKVTLQRTHDKKSPSSSDVAVWDSVADFPTEQIVRLDPWEQLAQVLLCSNEFMFVD